MSSAPEASGRFDDTTSDGYDMQAEKCVSTQERMKNTFANEPGKTGIRESGMSTPSGAHDARGEDRQEGRSGEEEGYGVTHHVVVSSAPLRSRNGHGTGRFLRARSDARRRLPKKFAQKAVDSRRVRRDHGRHEQELIFDDVQ